MKKGLFITAALFLIVTGSAVAAPSDKSHNNKPGKESVEVSESSHNDTNKQDKDSDDKKVTESSKMDCDVNGTYKNHGEFVSCVAKLHIGGDIVSKAAQTDIGKKNSSHQKITVTPTETVSPTGDLTPTPTVVLPTVQPTVLPMNNQTRVEVLAEIKVLLQELHKLLGFFKHGKK